MGLMKRILTIIFLLVLNFSLKAQILQQPNTYGIGWKRTGADTLLYIPSDTLQVPSWGVGKTHIARKGTALYYWDGSKWSAITGSGSTYTAGNGLTLSGSQFKLGSPLTENTTINRNSNNLEISGDGDLLMSITGGASYRLNGITGVAQIGYGNPSNIVVSSNQITLKSKNVIIDTAVAIGIGSPNASAILDVTSTTQGAVLPRMNTTQMNAISSPVAGLMVYNSDSTSYCYYNGSAWLKMGSGGGSQNLQQVTNVGKTTTDSLIIGTDNSSDFIANTDTVQASGYESIATGSPDLAALQNLYMMFDAQRSRIRQTGTITQIKMYFASKPAQVTQFYFDVWRKDGSTWDSVAHVPIWSLVSGGSINTINLPYAVNVREGDYVGCSWTGSSAPAAFIQSVATANAGFYTLSAPSWTDYNWAAATVLTGYVPIHVFMRAPVIVSIGNSIMAGYPDNYTFIETTENNNWTTTTPYKVADTLNVTHQNMAIAGQTTTQLLARFSADVVSAAPRFAIIEGGVNDVGNGVATTTIKSNWAAMIDSCVVNNIVPVVLGIYPWSNGSNAEMQKVDSINNYLDSLCATIPSSIRVDVSPYIGEFRVGGDPGNLWDIQAAYDYGDGVHLNEAGNARVASAILDSLFFTYQTKYYKGVITDGDSIYYLPERSGTILVDNSLSTIFSTGLTYGSGVVTSNISTGVSGGQTIYGGTAANDDLTIQGTSNATKTTSYVNIQPSGGNVGIGTTIPTNALHVSSSGGGTATLLLQNTNSSTTGYTQLGFRNNAGNRLYAMGIGNSGETSLSVKSNFFIYDSVGQAVRFLIDTTGKVGVSTVSPASKLDVNGSFGLSFTTTTTDITLNDTHYTVVITGGTPVVTLPAAASTNTRRIYVIVNQTGSGVTISSYLDFTGAGNTTVAANSAIQVQSNGTNWYRIL